MKILFTFSDSARDLHRQVLGHMTHGNKITFVLTVIWGR